MQVKIGEKTIKSGGKPYFIADIAANHDGSIERAFKLIELAKEVGADAAKFQNFHASKIVSKNGFYNLNNCSHQSQWKKSVYQVYEDASIPEEWTNRLKEKCMEVGIEYMTSPYDFHSVDLVLPYVNAFKIGSGDITWTEMIDYIAQKKKVVLLATGASNMEDVERAMGVIKRYKTPCILMQCNTNYTADANNIKYYNLNVLNSFKDKFPDCILGLSDHTFGHTVILGAIALGAVVFEKHFTDDNTRQGPDHKFAMNPITWKTMVEESNNLYEALGDGVKRVEDNEIESIIVQRRGVYTTNDMKQGDIIKKSDLTVLRPQKEGAVLPFEINDIVGKCLKKDIESDKCILWEDIKLD